MAEREREREGAAKVDGNKRQVTSEQQRKKEGDGESVSLFIPWCLRSNGLPTFGRCVFVHIKLY